MVLASFHGGPQKIEEGHVMTSTASSARAGRFKLHYSALRSVVSPTDQEGGRRRYCGVAKAQEFFDLGWDENVRGYLGEDDEGNKRKPTLVNLAVRETVKSNRDMFPMLNTGLVIVGRHAEVDDNKRVVEISDASIINGAQTMGVLSEFFGDHPDDTDFPWVNFELIITTDEELIGEISIARNFQNRVADLSIYGRQGRFDKLQEAIGRHDPDLKLRTKETDFGDEFLDTEKLIQALTALMPSGIPVPSADQRRATTPETVYRVYAYRHRSRCLKDFATIMDKPSEWRDAHRFFLDTAWDGWRQYQALKEEQAFSRLHKVKGETNGGRKTVVPEGVPDGIVFPILSGLSNFARNGKTGWTLQVPKSFPWNYVYDQAMVLFKEAADHNPNTMGKQAGCYIALHGLCRMFFASRES
jgi:hypothetical protein